MHSTNALLLAVFITWWVGLFIGWFSCALLTVGRNGPLPSTECKSKNETVNGNHGNEDPEFKLRYNG